MAHCTDHMGLVHDLASAEAQVRAADMSRERVEKMISDLEIRVRGLEVKIAAWAGGAALAGSLLPKLLEMIWRTQ